MSKKLILLFSHNLTTPQKKDAQRSMGITEFVTMPKKLKEKWSNIPPELENITDYLKDIRLWLLDVVSNNDYILIQGDFGATYYFVNWAFKNKLIPVYSTTKRIHKETLLPNESLKIIKTFEHKIYRKY